MNVAVCWLHYLVAARLFANKKETQKRNEERRRVTKKCTVIISLDAYGLCGKINFFLSFQLAALECLLSSFCLAHVYILSCKKCKEQVNYAKWLGEEGKARDS